MNIELNERVAVEVMGYKYTPFTDTGGKIIPRWRKPSPYQLVGGLPDYSGDIAAAWLVVEELAKRLIWLSSLEEKTPVAWYVVFRYWEPGNEDIEAHWKSAGSGFCATAPLAICHAALDICEKMKVSET